MARRVSRVARDALVDCFALRREAAVRRDGAWGLCQKIMVPGYIFLVATDADRLRERLGLLVAPYARLVQAGDRVCALAPDEVAFIQAFAGARRLVPMSSGSIVNGTLRVDRGPLRGREGLVANINRHKRCAWLRTGVLDVSTVCVGLEVASKT